MLDIVSKHDEILFGFQRQNTVGLVEQVTHINNQINITNNAPAPDVYTRTEANELFDVKADKTDLDDYYNKAETYAKVEVYYKTEVDEFLDEKAIIGTSHSKTEDDALLLLKADKTELIDSYSKTEDNALLLLKADQTDFDEYYTSGQFDTSACGTYITMREIEEAIADQGSVPYKMPVRFRVSVPLDDLLIFSAFTDNPNGMFGDLKIKFKINPNAFVFAQVNPTVSLAKYYTMNKDELLSLGQQKLMDIDIFFRNWCLTFQQTNQFTLLGCTADLITSIRTEQLTQSGLKNLVCDIAPVIISKMNYVIAEVTANMAGYKATDECLNRVRAFYSIRPFVVPAYRVEIWPFPTSATLTGIRTSQNMPLPHVTDFCLLFPKVARATTCFENPRYHNIQLTTCGRNFPNMPMNTTDQQFFQLQLNASNFDLLFEATDEFEDALTTPRNTATRRRNPHTDLTSFMITLQCERNSNGALSFDGLDTKNQNTSVELRGAPIYQGVTDCYYNVDTAGKRPSPPILCTVHDIFWLFSPNQGGSCVYDTTHSFDEVIGSVTA
ncbi:MAG: hypothetical protein EZS28_011005 [Streblomastix strix]|uniref:Uncharacterized protein n=1 Tax=Streblomastix strix TaxID=222440 RepID=A0A5J4WEV5_9EUKA|nr:MAG: hypothetical protein EZS28_011005 [Streblomastix strix]